MGRSETIHYVVEIKQAGVYNTPMEWRDRARYGCKGYGRPTAANLAKFVKAFEDSQRPGGANAHLGYKPVLSAFIRDQFKGNEVVAEYRA